MRLCHTKTCQISSKSTEFGRSFHRVPIVAQAAWQLPKDGPEVRNMNSHHLRNKVGRIFLALAFMAGIGIASSTAVQAQWPYGQDPYRRDRDRDYRRDDRNYRRDDRDYRRDDRDYRRDDRDYRRDDRYGRYGGYGN